MIKFIAFGKKVRAWKEEEGGGYIRGLFWSLSKKRHEDYPRLKIQDGILKVMHKSSF